MHETTVSRIYPRAIRPHKYAVRISGHGQKTYDNTPAGHRYVCAAAAAVGRAPASSFRPKTNVAVNGTGQGTVRIICICICICMYVSSARLNSSIPPEPEPEPVRQSCEFAPRARAINPIIGTAAACPSAACVAGRPTRTTPRWPCTHADARIIIISCVRLGAPAGTSSRGCPRASIYCAEHPAGGLTPFIQYRPRGTRDARSPGRRQITKVMRAIPRRDSSPTYPMYPYRCCGRVIYA